MKARSTMNAEILEGNAVELHIVVEDERTCSQLEQTSNLQEMLGNPTICQYDYDQHRRKSHIRAYYSDLKVARRLYYEIAEGNLFLEDNFSELHLRKGFNIIRDIDNDRLYVMSVYPLDMLEPLR